ncbi:MAG: class I SAM-dependent methyltransferase [Acidimicrobiales bacterium]
MASRNYDRIADRYEELRGGESRAEAIALAITPELCGPRVLDVGVGTGIVAAAFERRGYTVFGVDISQAMLARARPRLHGRIICATGERMPLRDHVVDTAIFVWSLHHIAQPVAALRDAARIVRPGGRVIVIAARPEPQPDEIGQIFTRLNELDRPDPATDLDLPTMAGLRTVATGAVALEFEQSPKDQAQLVEDRQYAPLWELDDTRWRAIVQPVIDALRALPDPDSPRTRVLRQPYRVFVSA